MEIRHLSTSEVNNVSGGLKSQHEIDKLSCVIYKLVGQKDSGHVYNWLYVAVNDPELKFKVADLYHSEYADGMSVVEWFVEQFESNPLFSKFA